MSILESKFNVRRGWPDSSTIDETFLPSPAASPVLDEGNFVTVQSDGTVDRDSAQNLNTAATTSAVALANMLAVPKKFWMIVSGNNQYQYDGQKQGWVSGKLGYKPDKVVAISGKFMVDTQAFVARGYVVGDKLTVISGNLDLTSASTNLGAVCVGEVYSYDATNGVLTATITI